MPISHLAMTTSEAWMTIRPENEQHFEQKWANPELPCMEYRSSPRLAEWLGRHGFELERLVGGIPTAFAARLGAGAGPVIGFL
ncbi:hypothetical protein [Aestuariivirga sp.]|uniref:hypothetical protein n=1 Tax=Aestuariivirga sp. TaxID=2650926 RepID=UPI003593ABC4